MIDDEGKEHDDRDGRYTGDGTASGVAAPEKAGKGKGKGSKSGTPEFIHEAEARTKEHVDSYNRIKAEMQGADPNVSLRHVARKFFDEKLDDKAFAASFGDMGDKKVQFIGGNFKELSQFIDKFETKADLFPHLTEILQTGSYLGAIDRPEHKNQYKKFHAFYKEVNVKHEGKDLKVKAIIDVAEYKTGQFAYHLNQEGYFTWEDKLKRLREAEKSGKLEHGVGIKKALVENAKITDDTVKHPITNASDKNLPDENSEVNLFILAAYDPETGEEYPEMMDIPPKEPTKATDTFNQRIQNWRIDEDGMLRVTAHILREGVYDYSSEECPDWFKNLPIVKQYIPASEFTPEALSSLEGKWVLVSAHEWRTDETTMADGLTVGSIAGTPHLSADGKAIECDMLIADRDAIEAIESRRLIEVSAAYRSELFNEAGEYGGVHYDAVQRQFEFNHVLLLPAGRGRCGSKVRIINQKQTNEATMAASFKVKIGNSERTLRFTNEEDAATAESAIEEEKKFNAEALAEHIAGREEVQAKLDEVNKQVTELKEQLAEHDKHLSEARAEIDRLLTPEAQEQLAEELNAQKDDEESIVEVEAENASAEEKEKVLNSIRSGKTLADRRVNAAKWHLSNRKLEAPKDANQSYFDGMFVGLATAAREKIQNNARRVPNGKLPERTKTANSGGERVMKSFYPKRKED